MIQYLENVARESGGDPAVEHAFQTVQRLQDFAPRGMRNPKAAAESNRKKLEIYERLLARNPRDETAVAGLAQAYADIGTIESCRRSLRIAAPLAGKPEFHNAVGAPYLKIAQLQLQSGDPRAALITVGAAEEKGFGRDGLLQGFKARALSVTGFVCGPGADEGRDGDTHRFDDYRAVGNQVRQRCPTSALPRSMGIRCS